MQRIGLLGGTFNPIHFGHLRMAQELAEALNLDEVRFIPSANPPHKKMPAASAEQRVQMTQLAIGDNPLFKIDTRELDRRGASYTIDTLISLRQEIGMHASICLIMGTDAFSKLNTWHRWQELLNFCHIILVKRSTPTLMQTPLNEDLALFMRNHYTEHAQDLFAQAAGYIHMQAITELDISSTAIRAAFIQKTTPRYLMQDKVINYIKLHQLYG